MKFIANSKTLLALAVALGSGISSHATIIATDSFSVTSDRAAGSTINGSQTETGGLTWNGGAQWILRENSGNGYMGTNSGNNASIAAPFNFASYQADGDVATISFSIAWRQQSGSWFGLGFSSSSSGAVITTSGAVWLQIDANTGIWSLKTNAPGVTDLPTGNLSAVGISFSTGTSTPYTYSLSYNSDTRTVTDVTINGTSVVSNYLLSSAPGSISSVAFFGQKPYNTATGTQIDNFSLSVSPSSIPEPGTWAAICGALGLAVSLFRRRSR